MISLQIAKTFWTVFKMFIKAPAEPQFYTTCMGIWGNHVPLKRPREPQGIRDHTLRTMVPHRDRKYSLPLKKGFIPLSGNSQIKVMSWISRRKFFHYILEVTCRDTLDNVCCVLRSQEEQEELKRMHIYNQYFTSKRMKPQNKGIMNTYSLWHFILYFLRQA